MTDTPFRQDTILDESQALLSSQTTIHSCLPYLAVLEGGELNAKYEISRSEMVLGRDVSCEICLPDNKLSRKHAKFDRIEIHSDQGVEWKTILTDLGSTNGTYVGGERISQIELRDGDKIAIGSILLGFYTAERKSEIGGDQPERDWLSGLHSRECFDSQIVKHFDRARCYFREMSMILLEIDRFQELSDSYGAEVSRSVIGELGKMIGSSLGAGQSGYRYFVNQFAIVLPDASLETALVKAEKLRSQCTSHSVCAKETAIAITVSLGVASLGRSMQSFDEFVAACSAALDQARKGGRNLVCWHRPAPEEPGESIAI